MKRILQYPYRRFKVLRSRPLFFLERMMSRRNALLLVRLFSLFAFVLALYSTTFHYMMLHEGKSFHWFVGVYWTLATMTTVGYGDIVFSTVPGYVFSVFVIVSGIFFLLVIIPFTLIQLFQSTARVPREVPLGMRGHIILTHYGPVTSVLIEKLAYYSYPYFLITSNLQEASELRDHGVRAILGDLDDAETYEQLSVEHAALIASTHDDVTNTTIIHAVRQKSESIHILATATEQESYNILLAAGANEVLTLDETMGQSLARRTIAGDAIAHPLGQFDGLFIVEAAACATPLVNKKLKDTNLRKITGVTVIGILDGPHFHLPTPDTVISKQSILVIAGNQSSIARYNELFCIYNSSDDPILIVGAGNVGRWVARSFDEHGLDYKVLEINPQKALNVANVIVCDAAQTDVLEKSGFNKAPAIIIATHNDDRNIYLATLYRSLRKDIQIISRATSERSVSLLHRAGCDIVLSYASFGSNFIINHLKHGTYLMLSEGVDVFKVKTPSSFIGKTIDDIQLRETIGCHVVGISTEGKAEQITSGETRFLPNSEIILIADNTGEAKFLKLYGREI